MALLLMLLVNGDDDLSATSVAERLCWLVLFDRRDLFASFDDLGMRALRGSCSETGLTLTCCLLLVLSADSFGADEDDDVVDFLMG